MEACKLDSETDEYIPLDIISEQEIDDEEETEGTQQFFTGNIKVKSGPGSSNLLIGQAVSQNPVNVSCSTQLSDKNINEAILSDTGFVHHVGGAGFNKGYSNHKETVPGRSRSAVTKCLEPGCSFECARIPRLRNHLEEVHGIIQEMREFIFKNQEEFKAWLSDVEREARCTYMRRRGWQTNKNQSLTSCYYCHRGGAYTSNATKKQTKAQGSCKIGVECTSSMKVTMWPTQEKDGQTTEAYVQVEAFMQHYGHNLDLEHTRITKKEKADIARKLTSGISRNKILDEIRGTLEPTAIPHRVHLLSLQDIYNIERKEGIRAKKGKVSCEAGTTVQAWIEKMQTSEDNPVLLIKYQQEKATEVCACLSDHDFLLVLQTSLQSMMLRKHGPNQCICMDITQGDFPSGNQPKMDPSFHLMVLSVLITDPEGVDQVFPVAWFVSNRKDKEVIEICLSRVQNNLFDLTLTPSHLMIPSPGITGGCDWFSIWTDVFGPGPRKIICGWHIVAEWKRLVQDPSFSDSCTSLEGTRLLANMNTVLSETSVENFVSLMKDFLDDLKSNASTVSFGQHFDRQFAGQPEVWSPAYRSESLSKAENRFDEFHSKMSRYIYHEGFKRKQLDVLIKILMKHSRDKALNKLRHSFRTMNDAVVQSMTSSKHLASLELPTKFVSPREDARSWSVVSVLDSVRAIVRPESAGQPARLTQLAVEYIVQCPEVDCCAARSKCPYRCSYCQACSHHLTCSCEPNQNEASLGARVMCEHCHLVCRYLQNNGREVSHLFAPAEPLMTFEVSSESQQIEDNATYRKHDMKPQAPAAEAQSEAESKGIVICVYTKSDQVEDPSMLLEELGSSTHGDSQTEKVSCVSGASDDDVVSTVAGSSKSYNINQKTVEHAADPSTSLTEEQTASVTTNTQSQTKGWNDSIVMSQSHKTDDRMVETSSMETNSVDNYDVNDFAPEIRSSCAVSDTARSKTAISDQNTEISAGSKSMTSHLVTGNCAKNNDVTVSGCDVQRTNPSDLPLHHSSSCLVSSERSGCVVENDKKIVRDSAPKMNEAKAYNLRKDRRPKTNKDFEIYPVKRAKRRKT